MQRQLGVWIVVTCVLLLGWGTAGAATPQRAAFRVTLTATLTKDWTATRTVSAECEEVTTNAGQWKLTLATRRASRIVIVGPSARGRPLRISPAVVRSIAGTATQDGSIRLETRGPRCTRSIKRTDCDGRRRSFRGATARLTSPSPGTARFARMQGASAARIRGTCPEEPADITAIRTDLSLADAPLSAADVFDRYVPRFFISGNTEQETTIEGDYDGRVIERVRWKLTFTRLR
ncbi:MAG: hypothetical protein M3P42_06305 [Actinomycetota bacterium]|nr:hypothetical protein [Actinomycetota bacterium]